MFNKMFNKSISELFLIFIVIIFVILILILPLINIFVESLRQGVAVYLNAITDPDAISAIKLTLFIAFVTMPFNLIFGISASWCISKFDFLGKTLLVTLIDLPFSISPVISGFMYILLYGIDSLIGRWFLEHNVRIVFAVPGLILATIFVTFPIIARQLIPLMQEQGSQEEEAAIMLGAKPWQLFFLITLPNIKWGIIYGVLLSTARAMGEFGAVSVLSGHIRGLTNTMPLEVEVLYNEYNFVAAFSLASILTLFALFTLLLKKIIEIIAEEK